MTRAYGIEIAELPIASTSGSLPDAMRYFEGVNRALQDTTRELATLTPPETAAGLHSAFVATMNEFTDLAEQAANQGRRMQVPDDLIRLANDPVVGVANFRRLRNAAITACSDLQAVADDRDFEIDLGCVAFSIG